MNSTQLVTCLVCGEAIPDDADKATCGRCKTPYHLKCWNHIQHCSVYGCGNVGTPRDAVVAEEKALELTGENRLATSQESQVSAVHLATVSLIGVATATLALFAGAPSPETIISVFSLCLVGLTPYIYSKAHPEA